MAPRRRPGTRVAVFSETPTWAASPGADTPLFDLASSHMAWNQRRRRASGCRVAVPAAAERWRGHLVRRQVRLRPATGEHVAHPHLSHSHPSGHLTSISRLSQLLSSGYLVSRAWRLPILPFSALTCLRFMLPIVPPCLGHSFSASWHDMAEDVSPAIMKHIGEHFCEIGEERIRRAGAKIASEIEETNRQLKIGEDPKPVPDIGFRVFSIDSPNFLDTYSEPGEQTQASLLSLVDNLKEDRTPEDLLFQVLPAFRIPYSVHVEKMDIASAACFNVNDGQLIACFDTEVSTAAIEKIAQMKPIYAVFRDASFASDSDAANFEELFKTYSPDTVRRVI